MLKHNNHLKHINKNLIKDTITDMGSKRSIAPVTIAALAPLGES